LDARYRSRGRERPKIETRRIPTDYLTKPIDREQLVAILSRLRASSAPGMAPLGSRRRPANDPI
jgi:DNA-binding response OmpR family regulator